VILEQFLVLINNVCSRITCIMKNYDNPQPNCEEKEHVISRLEKKNMNKVLDRKTVHKTKVGRKKVKL